MSSPVTISISLAMIVFFFAKGAECLPQLNLKKEQNVADNSFQNSIAKGEIEKMVQLYLNTLKEQNPEEESDALALIKKYDDYGHLRFGRSNNNNNNNNRFKYSDPDYGHMRFGK